VPPDHLNGQSRSDAYPGITLFLESLEEIKL
jgi:hypothetical protein